jgi:hypothetical protein
VCDSLPDLRAAVDNNLHECLLITLLVLGLWGYLSCLTTVIHYASIAFSSPLMKIPCRDMDAITYETIARLYASVEDDSAAVVHVNHYNYR